MPWGGSTGVFERGGDISVGRRDRVGVYQFAPAYPDWANGFRPVLVVGAGL